jgi:phage terminase large subunit
MYSKKDPNKIEPCNNPAIAKIWWEDSKQFKFVCDKHLNHMLIMRNKKEMKRRIKCTG